jgi:tetratricopeptide (TPR) repeat protein
VEDWRPLLRFTDGNLLTITVLVGQALRDGLRTRQQIERFVEELRAGEARLADEAGEGRTRSLGASLSYSFEHAFSEAERLQRLRVDWCHQCADDVLRQARDRRCAAGEMASAKAETAETPALRERLRQVAGDLTERERSTIRNLAGSWHELAEIQREREEPACVQAYQESLDLAEIMGHRRGAAVCAFNLGQAYKNLPEIRDFDEAERWCRRSLALTPEGDRLGRGRCLAQLGTAALERLYEARSAGRAQGELLKHLNAALDSYHEALELLPEDAINDLAVTHNLVGSVYADASKIGRALPHYREAIRYFEAASDDYGAGQTRLSVAATLALPGSGRLADAREYARAALRDFQPYGDAAGDMVQKSQQLLEMIEKKSGSP